MANFKILFRTYCKACEEESSVAFARVVDVPGKIWAKRVARAMIGEEVAADECLWAVITVEETEEPLNMGSWDPNLSWQRPVLELLFDRNDLGIKPVYTTGPAGQEQLAGFSFEHSASDLI